MTIRVGELVHQLRTQSRVVNTKLRDVELVHAEDQPAYLRVGDERLSWGGRTTQLLAGFLKGPGYKYLEREPLEWQAQIVRHHTRKNADTDAVLYVEGDNLAGIYDVNAKIIPLTAVAERMANVFDADDLADVRFAPDQVEVNILSNLRTVTVPGILGVPDRPLEGEVVHPYTKMKVGDLSAGGVRVIIQPGKPERAPSVHELWERCFCDNQMTHSVTGSQINLRGRTVPEILDELENVARTIFERLESSGEKILHSAQTPIPGTVPDFIRQVGREHGVNAATILRLQEQAASLAPNPTVYDVTQILTAEANREGLPVATRRSLQAIGGEMTVDTERMIHRCITCERPLTV